MAFIQTYRPQGGGSGPAETLRWAQDLFAQTTAWVGGALDLPLSETPIDADGIIVMSEVVTLYPADYQVLTGPSRIRIMFGADPATDTDDGIWNFCIKYQYAI